MTSSEITLRVVRSDDGVEAIGWRADEGTSGKEQAAQAFILALWDADERNALRIDLWTKEMSVDDMNDFFFQTLMTMADTYANATTFAALAGELNGLAREFAEEATRAARRSIGEAGWAAGGIPPRASGVVAIQREQRTVQLGPTIAEGPEARPERPCPRQVQVGVYDGLRGAVGLGQVVTLVVADERAAVELGVALLADAVGRCDVGAVRYGVTQHRAAPHVPRVEAAGLVRLRTDRRGVEQDV